MTTETLKKVSAAGLFATALATIGVMWHPALWASTLPGVPAFCLVSVWLAGYLTNRVRLKVNIVLAPLVLAALWPVFQLAIGATVYRWLTSTATIYWATGAALVFTGLQAFSDSAIRRGYLRALVVLGFIIAVVAPLQALTSEKIFWLFEVPHLVVPLGPFLYANQYAAFIVLILPIALTGLFEERAGWRMFSGLAGAVMYASIFASLSRSGFVLTTIEVFVVPALAAKRSGLAWRQTLAVCAVFLAMLVVLGLSVGTERLEQKMRTEDPYRIRREFAQSSLRMLQDRPLMGVGMGNWPTVYPAYATFDNGLFANQAHCDWAQWAVEGGLPFAFLMVWVAVWSFRGAFRTGWGFGVAVVYIQCLIDFPIQRMGVAVIFFTLTAAMAYPDERSRRRTRAAAA